LEPLSASIQENHRAPLGPQRFNRVNQRFGAHQHPSTAAVRFVVYRTMLADPPLAKVMDA
jgi:hypothetical protein